MRLFYLTTCTLKKYIYLIVWTIAIGSPLMAVSQSDPVCNISVFALGDEVCTGETILLKANSPTATNYSWKGPGNFNSTIQNPTRSNATFLMSGVYSVYVTGSNGGSTCTGSATTSVLVKNVFAQASSRSATVCAGETINLSASGGIKYNWTGPNGYSAAVQAPARTNATAGMSGVYSVTVTGSNACTALATTSVVVGTGNNATAASNTPVCKGQTISLSASGGTTYSWAGPSGFSATVANPTRTDATLTMSGMYSVTVLNGNCLNTTTVSVQVQQIEAIATTATPSVCLGQAIVLSASGGTTYTWAGPGGFIANVANPTRTGATLAMSGVYSVSVSNGNGGCIASATVSVNVNETATLTVTGSKGLCEGGTISLSARGAATYLWSGPLGFTSTQAAPVRINASPSMNGVYSVTGIISSGCSATGTVSVVVLSAPLATVFNNHSNGLYCLGNAILLSASGGVSFSWSGPSGFSSTLQNPNRANANADMSGVYSVTVAGNNNCTASATTRINVTSCTVSGGSVGDYVWKDQNTNGVQDLFEPGVENVKVELYPVVGGVITSTPLQTTFTDTKGYYKFLGLITGEYKVCFVKSTIPPGSDFTSAGQSDDFTDSDPDNDGFTDTFFINATGIEFQKDNTTVDAGITTRGYDLSLDKAITKLESPEVGQKVTFSLTVNNAGTFKTTGVEVKDKLPEGLKYMSATTSTGSYDAETGIWKIGDIAAKQQVMLTIVAEIVAEGLWFNTAEVSKMNELDVDSTPNNADNDEDDLDRVCVSVPFKLCGNEMVVAQAPEGLYNMKWFKNGEEIKGANARTLEITEGGSYTFSSTQTYCPDGTCCPIEVKVGDFCCKKDACTPFVITRTQ